MTVVDILESIIKRDLPGLCKNIALSFKLSKAKCKSKFIQLYCKHFVVTDKTVLKMINNRLRKLEEEHIDIKSEYRIMIELFLILYSLPMKLWICPPKTVKCSIEGLHTFEKMIVNGKIDELKASIDTTGKQTTVRLRGVPDKFSNEKIWVYFYYILSISRRIDESLFLMVNQNLNIFLYKFNKSESKKRVSMLHHLIDVIVICLKEGSFESRKIDSIFDRTSLEVILKLDFLLEDLGIDIDKKSKELFHLSCLYDYPKLL